MNLTKCKPCHVHSDCKRFYTLLIFIFYFPPLLHFPPSKRPHNASVLLLTRVTHLLNAIQLCWGNHGASVLTELKYYSPIWVSFHKYRNWCFTCGGREGGGLYGGGREGNSGIRAPPLSPHVQMNNGGQQKNMLWFLSMGNAGNLLDFHTPPPPGPSPAAPTRHPPPYPLHTGQQEIGIQCFLDDFLKEMNPSQKMRTMNNGTPGGMCLTRAVRAKSRARSREACMK